MTQVMYVVIARGDRYENCNYDQDWESNLFCTPDEDFAKRFVNLLCSNKMTYLQEIASYKCRESEFINQWEIANPKPEFVELPKPIKPVHPTPHPSLKGLSRKEKKDNPYQQIYLKELRLFEKEIAEYNYSYTAIRSKEEAPSNKWWEDRESARKAFRTNNFKPDSFLPEWEMLSKFETYFKTGISFFCRELEIFLPPQQDGSNKEHA
jgi:hypothetical protein